jgi:hypothetical protein
MTVGEDVKPLEATTLLISYEYFQYYMVSVQTSAMATTPKPLSPVLMHTKTFFFTFLFL